MWRWGRGPEVAILPGVAQALLGDRALAWAMRRLWKEAARRYRLTLVAARESIPPGFTTEQMAEDVAEALAALHCEPRLTVGLEAGGLVAQWLAARWPARAGALALLSSPLWGHVPAALGQFLEELRSMLRAGDWTEAFDHAVRVFLEPAQQERLRWELSLLRRWGRPADLHRSMRILGAFRSHEPPRVHGSAKVPVLTVCAERDPLPGGLRAWGPASGGGAADVWPHPTRQVWLAGARGALIQAWPVVMEEMRRFERDAYSGAARA